MICIALIIRFNKSPWSKKKQENQEIYLSHHTRMYMYLK